MNLFEILIPCFIKGYILEFNCEFDAHVGERYFVITIYNVDSPDKKIRCRIDTFCDDFLNNDAENYFCMYILNAITHLNPEDAIFCREYSSKSPEDKIDCLYCCQTSKEVLKKLLDNRREHGPFSMDMVKAGKKFQRDLKEGLTESCTTN